MKQPNNPPSINPKILAKTHSDITPTKIKSPKIEASKFGYIAENGAVWLKTPTREIQVGIWQAENIDQGIQFYAQKYDELITELNLIKTRLLTHGKNINQIEKTLTNIKNTLTNPNYIGDLEYLSNLITEIETLISTTKHNNKLKREIYLDEIKSTKIKLIAEAENIANNSDWKTGGERLKSILSEWKQLKGLDKTTDDELWHKFAAARNTFEKKRSKYFSELDKAKQLAKEKKEALIKAAEQIKQSTDWNQTSLKFQNLMKNWKTIGPTFSSLDNHLWQKFKQAQDEFFTAKKAAQIEIKEQWEQNAIAKEKLLTNLEERFNPDKNINNAKNLLDKFLQNWNDDLKVPKAKQIEFNKRINKLEQQLKEKTISPKSVNSELTARAAKFHDRALYYEQQAQKAKLAGDEEKFSAALSAAKQWQKWAETAQTAVDN